jgi:hypothetical protein
MGRSYQLLSSFYFEKEMYSKASICCKKASMIFKHLEELCTGIGEQSLINIKSNPYVAMQGECRMNEGLIFKEE